MKRSLLILLGTCLLLLPCCTEHEAASHQKFDAALSIKSISFEENASNTKNNANTRGETSVVTSIGISRLKDGHYSAQDNYNYVYETTWKPADPSKIITISASDATLCAYTPYSATTNLSAIPFTSGGYVAAKDFCYGYKSNVNNNNIGTGVDFTLTHAYAELTLRFTKDDTFIGKGDVTAINITGALISASLDLSTPTPIFNSTTSGTVSITGSPLFNIISGKTVDIEVLMVPTTISSGLTFTLTVDGLQKTCTLPAANLKELVKGTNYVIPIGIGAKKELVLSDEKNNYVTTTDWIVSPDIGALDNECPESNCYIVPPNSTIYIPVSRAETGNPDNFKPNENFTTGFLWTDVKDLIKPPERVGRLIKVTTNGLKGNAVVYAKKTPGNEIVWSWHIWVTDYNPNSTYETLNNHTWMDRNLGAMDKVCKFSGTEAYGLYYQWGRKDPFPCSDSSDSDVEKILYGEDGNTFAINLEEIKDSPNLINSIKQPSTFFFSNKEVRDWYARTEALQNNSLWKTTKTIYDPCPVGWKVPSNTVMTGFDPNKFGLGSDNREFLYESFHLPITGARYHGGGKISNSKRLSYWSATYSRITADLTFSGSAYSLPISFTDELGRASGCPVRCIKGF